MHSKTQLTLGGLLAIVCVLVVLVVFLVPLLQQEGLGPSRVYCMSNLRSINSAIMLYKSANDGCFPWLYDTMTAWDTTEVGTNRNVNPFGTKDDPNNPRPRSITSLMFMLVRQDQPAGIFRCPSDRSGMLDDNPKARQDDGDMIAGNYYMDFSKPQNVSYSWQAPIWKNGRFAQGVDSAEPETVVAADMTPRYGWDEKWTPRPIDSQSTQADIEKQLSYNHNGKQVNILRVAGNISCVRRPDVGKDNDNIYTASGNPNSSSQGATSLDIRQHLSTRDTFLIGPVGRTEAK